MFDRVKCCIWFLMLVIGSGRPSLPSTHVCEAFKTSGNHLILKTYLRANNDTFSRQLFMLCKIRRFLLLTAILNETGEKKSKNR